MRESKLRPTSVPDNFVFTALNFVAVVIKLFNAVLYFKIASAFDFADFSTPAAEKIPLALFKILFKSSLSKV